MCVKCFIVVTIIINQFLFDKVKYFERKRICFSTTVLVNNKCIKFVFTFLMIIKKHNKNHVFCSFVQVFFNKNSQYYVKIREKKCNVQFGKINKQFVYFLLIILNKCYINMIIYNYILVLFTIFMYFTLRALFSSGLPEVREIQNVGKVEEILSLVIE